MKYLYKPISVFLSINLLMIQLVSGRTQDDKNDSGLINVGYIGESFNNIPDGYQRLVRQKMLGVINQNYYEFFNPIDLEKSHADAMKKLFSAAKDSLTNDLSTLAKATELDYIFLTTLDNISEDTKRVMLKGEVVRYDAKANQLFRHEILSYAEDIDLHIKEIKIKLIDTIPHSIHTIGRNRIYLLAGIAIVLAFAIGQSFAELSRYLSSGDGSDADTSPPVQN